MSVTKQIEAEIVNLHVAFEQWYNNLMPKSDLEKEIGGRLANLFYIVFPDATKQKRTEFLAMLEKDHGNSIGFRIEIRDVHIEQIDTKTFLATYEEWQYWETASVEADLKIRTSSVLQMVDKNPQWISIHETKIG